MLINVRDYRGLVWGQTYNLLVLLDDIVIDKRIPITGKLASEKISTH